MECIFDPAIFDPAIFDECVTPKPDTTHQGLIAPWVRQRATPGLLYPPKVLALFISTTQPVQSEHIAMENREDESWLLLTV